MGDNRDHCGIEIQNLALDYPVGQLSRGSVKADMFSLFGAKQKTAKVEFVRAIRGISLKVGAGERLGIIGRNGSGKSTLLRAMAGIYEPTSGVVEMHGRVQGMFDIGLGFESEATGRENILYRGLVMGLSPAQVRAREQEIIEFAAIGDFIDLPVRTYSSGMSVRLAFAISTYLEGDILLLDEMLGAGDASFQVKAAERMRSLVETAKVLVLVSHDMSTILNVCTRVIWLSKGRIVAEGKPDEVVEKYLADASE